MFTADLFTTAKIWKQSKFPINYSLKNKWYIYIYICIYVCVCVYIYIYSMEYYSGIKINEIMPSGSNMDGPTGYHTKWTKKEEGNII